MKKFLIGIAVIGAALFGLTACGGYDDSTNYDDGGDSGSFSSVY